MKIELHIFTNSTRTAPSTSKITDTYQSFLETFTTELIPNVWCDRRPNFINANEYLSNLKKLFPVVNESKSLSAGYVTAIKESDADFLFMLEHDWKFLDNIPHTLDDIMKQMYKDQLIHLRFNKYDNIIEGWDTNLQEVHGTYFNYCITPCLSNNPHIINRKLYIDNALNHVIVKNKGSKGIEDRLTKNSCLTGSIYGPLKYPKTIEHTDGKSK